jgi:hypothetical protein
MQQEKIVRLGLIAGAGILIIYLLYRMFGKKTDAELIGEIPTSSYVLNETVTVKPTLTNTELSAIAQSIYSSFHWYNDDEQAVYSQFRRLNNDADFTNLVRIYGTRGGKDIFNQLQSSFNLDEITVVNNILSQKGINYSF